MKSIFKNTIYNLLYKFLMLVFPLISSIYVSRVLLPIGVGEVAYAQNVVSYFIAISGLGMSNYGVREIAKVQNDKKLRSKLYYELLLILLCSTFVASILYFGLVLHTPTFYYRFDLYFVAGLQLVFSAFNVDWFYQGMEEYRYITLRSFIIKILSLVCIFLSVKTKEDTVCYALISSIALAGNNIINLLHARKYVCRVKFQNMKFIKHIKPLMILLSTGLAIELYTKLDTTTLGIICGNIAVGYYSYATKISSIVIGIVVSLSVVLLPRLSYLVENNDIVKMQEIMDKATRAILTISIPACIGVFFLAREIIVLLFGIEFLPAVFTLRILSLLIVIKSIGNLFGTQLLLAFGREKLLLYSTILGAITNIVLNILFIPKYQENGAAFASVISEVLVCAFQILMCKKIIMIKFNMRDFMTTVFASIGMICGIFFVRNFIITGWIYILLVCLVGVLIYFFLCVILKNEIVFMIFDKIKFKTKNTKDG